MSQLENSMSDVPAQALVEVHVAHHTSGHQTIKIFEQFLAFGDGENEEFIDCRKGGEECVIVFRPQFRFFVGICFTNAVVTFGEAIGEILQRVGHRCDHLFVLMGVGHLGRFADFDDESFDIDQKLDESIDGIRRCRCSRHDRCFQLVEYT